MNIRAFTYRLLGYKTVEELLEELRNGKAVSGKAIKNARKLSKALLPKQLFYPKGGEIIEALRDIQVSYMTHFMAPHTGGGKAKLLKGERLIVRKPNQTNPLVYNCFPVNPEEAENRIVPHSDRNDPAYDGFSLSIDTEVLNVDFKLAEPIPIRNKTNPTSNE